MRRDVRWTVRLDRGLNTVSRTPVDQRALWSFAVAASSVILVLAAFWPTTLSMIEIWRRSDTFHHSFAAVPIAIWLVWLQRHRLAAVAARPFWPGVIGLVALGLVWVAGTVGAAQVVSQFALVGLIAVSVLTAFGTDWFRILWFPLIFLVYAVPFGEALIPLLMEWTADFTVFALQLTGVPVYREGMHFVIPTGAWSVIEACSGIKFLISSLMTGSLYAWLMYRSPARRTAFVLVSVAVPIFANWLRAYFIVLVGHLTENRLMTNDDHIAFGWILFAAIMVTLFWVGARWREDDDNVPASTIAPAVAWQRPAVGAVAVALCLAVWPVLARALMQPLGSPRHASIVAPVPANGWMREADALGTWIEELDGAKNIQSFAYRKGEQRVELFVGVFRDQTQTAQAGSSANTLLRVVNAPWIHTEGGTAATMTLGVTSVADPVRTARLRNRESGVRLLVWQWYWAGDAPTGNAGRTKLELARDRVLRRPDVALWIALYSRAGEDDAEAEDLHGQFLRDMDRSLKSAFERTATR